MSSSIQQKLVDISSLTSKLLRKSFGRGPESCQAFGNGPFLVIYIKRFLSPMEFILLENGNSDNIDISRNIVMNNVLSELRGILELEFKQDVKCFYHDWNYPNNTGIITVEFELSIITGELNQNPNIIDDALIKEVERISILIQKRPEKTKVYPISSKIYLVKREGILIEIEKALIERGYEQVLIVTKDELEKSYLHRNAHFEEIFQNSVADIFVDWNLRKDDSILCFILK